MKNTINAAMSSLLGIKRAITKAIAPGVEHRWRDGKLHRKGAKGDWVEVTHASSTLTGEGPFPVGHVHVERGSFLNSDKYHAEVVGYGRDNTVVGAATPEEAHAAGVVLKSQLDERHRIQEARERTSSEMASRLTSGGASEPKDLEFLGLKPTSNLTWFMPAAAHLFGISSKAVRPLIKDMVRTLDSNLKKSPEVVPAQAALEAIGRRISGLMEMPGVSPTLAHVHSGVAYAPAGKAPSHDWEHARDTLLAMKAGDPEATRSLAAHLATHPELHGFQGIVVPVPRHTPEGRPHHRFALALVENGVGSEAVDILKRTKAVESSRARRQRGELGVSPDEHAATITAMRPSEHKAKPILLVDDMFTSGSTLRGSAMALRKAGYTGPIVGATAGYAIDNPHVFESPITHAVHQADAPWTASMAKSGGPYIGPQGGKWADPQHTVHWEPTKPRKPQQAKVKFPILDNEGGDEEGDDDDDITPEASLESAKMRANESEDMRHKRVLLGEAASRLPLKASLKGWKKVLVDGQPMFQKATEAKKGNPPIDGNELTYRVSPSLIWQRLGENNVPMDEEIDKFLRPVTLDEAVADRKANGTPIVVAYGMGVDSTAMLVGMEQRGVRPDAIIFADTGGEKPETYAFRAYMDAWLATKGFPPITVVKRDPTTNERGTYTSLEQECTTNDTMPSLAFGGRKCSQKWKHAPQHTFLRKDPKCIETWAKGGKVNKLIGYDAGPADSRRPHIGNDEHYRYAYPLREWGWDREESMRQIAASGLPIPLKSSCFFCLGGETEVVTRDGIRKIRDLVGFNYLLVPKLGTKGGLSNRGSFKLVEVRSFGVQPLYEISLKRGSSERVIRATAEHRWVLTPNEQWSDPKSYERTTSALQLGDKLRSLRAIAPSSEMFMPVAAAQGFVYGDGTCPSARTAPASVRIYNIGKDSAMLSCFSGYTAKPYEANGKQSLNIYGLPRFWKKLPPTDESRSFLLSWLSGYFAADGSVMKNGCAQIESASSESLEFVRDIAAICGVGCGRVRSRERSGFGRPLTSLYRVTLRTSDLPDWFFRIATHCSRVRKSRESYDWSWKVTSVKSLNVEEEVFCAIVPGAEAFGLGEDLMTGNCPAMKPHEVRELSTDLLRRIVTMEANAQWRQDERVAAGKSAIQGLWRQPVAGSRGAIARPGSMTEFIAGEGLVPELAGQAHAWWKDEPVPAGQIDIFAQPSKGPKVPPKGRFPISSVAAMLNKAFARLFKSGGEKS